MAAPAGGGGSAVSVLAPNGRRHTVKVTPSTVLLQVLEDTCRRQDFNPSEYDLKFQRNVLDLTLQWRFANLPNNAKLEMVPISRSREGPENMVRIALQLDDGSRLQGTFCSGQTLWELLSHFAQTRECLERPCEASPVCVYMRDEVTGRAALQGTTLQSLGLTGGSAIIRFAMKQRDSAGKPEPGGLKSERPASPAPSAPADQAAGSPLLPSSSAGLSRGDGSRQDETGPSEAGHVDSLGPKPVDAQAKPILKEPAPVPFVPFSGGGQRLGGPSGSSRTLMSPSAKLPKSFSSPGGPSKPKKLRPGQEPQPEPEPEPELEPPVDRDPVVCHPDLEELLQAWPAELPDEFFQVTVDDVRRRLAQLQSERWVCPGPFGSRTPMPLAAPRWVWGPRHGVPRQALYGGAASRTWGGAREKSRVQLVWGLCSGWGHRHLHHPSPCRKRLEEAPLVTKAFREAQMKEKLERYPKVVLRVLFPDRYILQGFFRPSETVIAPPKTILDDHTMTLFQANLFPAALVHFGAEVPTGLYLEPRLLEHTISPSAADVLVAKCMSRAPGTPPPLPAPDPAPLESKPAAEEQAVGPPELSPGTAQPVRRDLGKVPKWLKLPGTVGGWPAWEGLQAGGLGPTRSSWFVCTAAGKR
uniref:ASPSCR1 tether for SLC2A4, UBX domain containing n=1 Tax=Equus caballus TaxID=9796 RepID=A0A3Q2GTS7_HORSE